MEPIILELEREQNDLLIIAHESVLRVLYAYLMHCSAMDIPKLKFPRNKIIEIIPAAYQNEAQIVGIPGLSSPANGSMSPDNVFFRTSPIFTFGSGAATDAVNSAAMSPIQGLSTPVEPLEPLTLPPAGSSTSLASVAIQSAHGSPATSQPQSQTHSRMQSEAQSPVPWATERVINTSKDAVADKVADED